MEKENQWKEQQPYAYWLQCVQGLGRKSRQELTEYAGSPRAVYEMAEREWRMLLPEKKVNALKQWRKEVIPELLYKEFAKGKIRFIPMGHPNYPKRLRQISDPPYGIFVMGSLPEDEKMAVAVIGARQCSEYGRYIAGQCAAQLAMTGANVISGMARGIDGIAHGAAMQAGGNTFAVLGCGTDVCYPAENRQLYEAMKQKGGIVSEYGPGTQPKAGLFPVRNRIISGLADIVLIVEAREKSGTLITADLALEQGKEVYVVPGRVTDSLSQGCNRLIAQGAGIMTSVDEMLRETGLAMSLEGKRDRTSGIQKSKQKSERKGGQGIVSYLDYYPKSIACLQQESGLEYRQIILELTELCARQQAIQVSVNQYIKT